MIAQDAVTKAGSPQVNLVFESAGVSARSGIPRCEQAQQYVRKQIRSDPANSSATSRPVSRNLLRRADLVLAADRATASTLLRRWPEMREKVFPITVAAALADHVIAPSASSPRVSDQVFNGGLRNENEAIAMASFIDQMNFARGRVSLGADHEWPRRHSFRKVSLPASDLPDPHEAGAQVVHNAVIREVARSTDSLVSSLVAVLRGIPCADQ